MIKLWRLRKELRQAERRSREVDKSYINALENLIECDKRLIKVLENSARLQHDQMKMYKDALAMENMFHPLVNP